MNKEKQQILIVEDEEQIARFVELELVYEGYQVTKAFDGRKGLEIFNAQPFDLILLDVMLPGMNGLDVLRRIRQISDIPVIMLTARGAIADKVAGLDLGSNDYVTKPFVMEELLARIRAALRRRGGEGQSNDLTIGPVVLDPVGYTVKVGSQPVELTKREFDLLCYLMKNQDVALTRDILLSEVWGYDYQGETNVVDVYVRYLRSKIDEPFGVKLITTVRGVGYVVKHEE